MKFRNFACSVVACLATGSIAGASVMDQIGPDTTATAGTSLFASQQFEPGNAVFDIAAIDDFLVTAPVTLGSVEAVIGFFNTATPNFANITSWRVEIYSSPTAAASSLVGDVASVGGLSSASNVPFGGPAAQMRQLVLLNIASANITLGAGTYWIGVIPVMNFGSGFGQTGIAPSTIGNLNAEQANPGGGFAFPGNHAAIAGGANLAYRINEIPAPGALAILGLAGLIGTSRRRR